MVLDAESIQVCPIIVQELRDISKEKLYGKYSLPKMAPNPFVGEYRPETDTTYSFDPDRAYYYQTMIGVMRWMLEIDRIDIAT